jgi:hypothetical protein
MLRLNLVVSQERERLYQRKYAEYRAKLAAVRTSDSTSATSMPSAILAVTPPPRPEEAFLAYDTAVELLLDIIDGLLDLIPYKPAPSDPDPVVRFLKQAGRKFTRADPRKQLQQLLDDARSVYTIRDDGHGLERRISIAPNKLVRL